jgi:hypothetical protein
MVDATIPTMPSPLAIVLPAFRTRFLREALESLASQTRRDFRVYLFDDASPEDIAAIGRSFQDRLDLRYHRFEENLGGKNLVAHWHRCIDRTEGEPWLWLFSDDDIADPGCVEALFDALARCETPCDLWRFDLDFIDEHGRVTHRTAPHPDFETAPEFLRNVLVPRHRDWRAADHIFSRRAYETLGGFIDFPNAIFSDIATWIHFSTVNGVRTLRGPRLGWRTYGGNVTAHSFKRRRQIAEPLFQMHAWMARFEETLPPAERAGLRELRRNHFIDWIAKWPVPPAAVLEATQVAARLWPETKFSNCARLLRGELRAAAWRLPLTRRYQKWRLQNARVAHR